MNPQRWARIGGWLYLAIIVLGLFGEAGVRGALVVPGDAAATVARIAASRTLWRTGIATDLLMHLLDVPVMLALYLLLRPVNERLAWLATFFNLVQTAVLAANKLNLLLPIFLIDDAARLQAFTPEQLHALSFLAIEAHSHGFGIGLLFFGATCLVRGWLLWASRYFPRWIGALTVVAGACYLVNSFALLVAPPLAALLFPWVLLPALVGELSLTLWLLVRGVDLREWEKRVTLAAP